MTTCVSRLSKVMSTLVSQSPLNISETIRDGGLVPEDLPEDHQ